MVINITSISGQHVFQESGAPVVISGQPVTISGDHVFVESGVYVASGQHVVISGQPVIISGQHVHLESGDTIDTYVKSGSVTDAYIYGQHVLSGDWRPISVCSSGEVTVCSGLYVVADIAESGIGVQVQSGLHVIISGQHFFQESGAYVVIESGIGVTTVTEISGTPVTISGDHVFIESGAHVIVDSGLGVRANILDTAGNIMEVDQTVKAGVIITTPHHEIHEGNMWNAWCIHSGLADNEVLDMLIVTGSGKETHMAPDGACGGDAWFEIYEGTAVSDNGTLITPNCMNRVISGTATTLTYCGPTVTSTMHPLLIQFMPGGQKNFAIGGVIRPNTEWILNGVSGNMNYLLRVKNVTGAAKDSSIALEWYEE